MTILIIYCIIGILWGFYAAKKQNELYHKWVIQAAIVNAIFWPICLLILAFKEWLKVKETKK